MLTRRRRRNMANQLVEVEDMNPAPIGIRSRYNQARTFRVRRNNYDLRANLQFVYDRMTQFVQPGHRYRIHFTYNNGAMTEYFVTSRDRTRQNRRAFTVEQWVMPETFEEYVNF